jgi:hypothetical protein
MKPRQPSRVNKEIKKVSQLIQDNIELMEKYPEEIGLELDQFALEKRYSELTKELEESNEYFNIDSFRMIIEEEAPPVKNVLEISNALQNLFYPLAQAEDGPVKRGSHPSIDIKNAVTLGLERAEAGSLILYFKTDPLKTDSQKKFITRIRLAMNNLNSLIFCGSDKELLKKQVQKLGLQSIDKYRIFLEIISRQDIDITLFDAEYPKGQSKQIITSYFAKEVYQTIIASDNPTEEIVEIEGKLGVIDTFNKLFKMKINLDNRKNKIISIKYDDKLTDEVKKRLKKKVIAEVKLTEEYHEIEDKTGTEMKLTRFITE